MKHCNNCNTDKDIKEFSLNKSKKDGRQVICKLCHKKYRREHYLKNKVKVIDQVKLYKKCNPISSRIKSGRNYVSSCRDKNCNNTSYITKKDFIAKKERYCSRLCANKSLIKSPCIFHYNKAYRRAYILGMDFNISVEFLENLLVTQSYKCAITNVPIKVESQRGKTLLYSTGSLDRIDSSKGYTMDNVQWVVLGINYMKRNFEEKDLHKLLQLITTYY